VSLNITSLVKNLSFVVGISDFCPSPVHVVALQETRIPPDKSDFISGHLSRHGWHIVFGHQPEIKPTIGKKNGFRQTHGGTAFLIKSDIQCQKIDIPEPWSHVSASTTILWVNCATTGANQRCSSGIYIVNSYLPTGRQNKEERERVAEGILSFLSTLEPHPVFWAGDFQELPEENRAIIHGMLANLWFDAYALVSSTKSSECEATFSTLGWKDFGVKPGQTRIDHFLCNYSAMSMVGDCVVIKGSPFKGHRPVFLTIRPEVIHEPYYVVTPHDQWELPPKPRNDSEWDIREASCRPILDKYVPELIQASSTGDAEQVWSVACQIASDMLDSLASTKTRHTRGTIPKFKLFSSVSKNPTTWLTKTLARITEIESIMSGSIYSCHSSNGSRGVPLSQPKILEITNLEKKVQCWFNKFCPDFHFRCFPVHDFPHVASEARNKIQEAQAHEEEKRRIFAVKQWKKKIQISSQIDKKFVFSWLKGKHAGPPKCFLKEDNEFTASPNEMLDMLSDHMEDIYNEHAGVDPQNMLNSALRTYSGAIDQLHHPANIPDIDHHDVFKLFQRKSECKAGGFDGWKTKELQALPPCGWVGFTFVMRLAEAYGVWPKVLRMVAVTAISKGAPISSPQNVRAIGVSSAIYGIWSSLRFRQLAPWMAQVFPNNLVGGIPNRQAFESELSLSLDFHENNFRDDPIAVFIDRTKCFDLILPELAMGLASSLGIPDQIFRATLAFYHHQVKIFKLGNAYGRKVMGTNAAVQGCSMSIIMVNSMYAILSAHLQRLYPKVSSACFIDDVKIWAKGLFSSDLEKAFNELVAYDTAVGQKVNFDKTFLLARKTKKAEEFLRRVRVKVSRKTVAKSLGFTHRVDRLKSAAFQNSRVESAFRSLKKLSCLPCNEHDMTGFIHSVAHSKWLHGVECQLPNNTKLDKLRKAVVKALSKGLKTNRSPYLILATGHDPFVDPEAAAFKRILSRLRDLAFKDPAAAARLVSSAKEKRQTCSANSNGAANVLAVVFSRLKWSFREDESMTFSRPGDTPIDLLYGSKKNFHEELARSVRVMLLARVPARHDWQGELDLHIDIAKTRILEDASLASFSDRQLAQNAIQFLPKNHAYTKSLLRALRTGSVLTRARCKAAGITTDDKCEGCDQREDHLHLFKSCGLYERNRPSSFFHDTTWCTGIFPEGELITQWRQEVVSRPVLPMEDFQAFEPESPIFVDGSCFHHSWAPMRSAAAAVVSKCGCSKAYLLPGLDQTSQRAEIFAVIAALWHCAGNITIYSDCANVVNIVNFLRRCGFSNKCITNLDNRDLWVLFNFVANKRSQPFAMYKVKAHCGKHDLCQDPFLTEGNSCADKLAKDTAWAFLEARQQTACEELALAMSLQAHLVHTLATRSSLFKMLPAEIPAGQDFFPHYKVLTSSFVCSCAPKTRIFSKGSVCSGTCRPLVIRAGDAENMFISCVKRGEPISPFIRTRVSSHHNRYIAIAYPQEMWQPLVTSPDPAFLAAGPMRLSPSAAGAICEFFSQSAWVVGSHRSIHRTSWVEIMADFVFQFGYFPGFINQSMTLKVLVQRFKRAAMRLFQSHQLSITALRSTHLLSFGFCHVASLHISRSFHFPDHIFAFLMGCASRFAAKNNPLNFVPPLHEFF
jgi:ribonuclease HI/exonuclease III